MIFFFKFCKHKRFNKNCGPKNLATPAHFTSSPRPMSRRKKCPGTNKEGSNCQDILPMTILFSASRDHGRRKHHASKGNLLECPKGKHKRNGLVMGAWWRSNSKEGCHLHLKYPQLTSWPHLCGRNPGQCYLGHHSSQNVRRSGWWDAHSSIGMGD